MKIPRCNYGAILDYTYNVVQLIKLPIANTRLVDEDIIIITRNFGQKYIQISPGSIPNDSTR